MEFKEAFLEIKKGKPLHYFFAGQGSPIVFLHGAADSPKTFLPQAQKLAKTHLCLMPYLPGHGRSHQITKSASLHDFTKAIHGLVTALNLNKLSLIGYSFGAAVAVDFTLKYPSLTEKLVIIDGLVLKAHLPFSEAIPHIVGDYVNDSAQALRRSVPLKVLTSEELSADLFDLMLIHKVIHRVNFEKRLAQIKVPTLILWGQDDSVLPVSFAHRLRKGIRGSKLLIFPGGHSWKRFQPEEMTSALRKFLS